MRRRWKLLLAAFLLALLSGAIVYPPSRYCLWGWLKGEPTYRGRPVTYWREAILANMRPPPPSKLRVELAEVLWDHGQEIWQKHFALASGVRNMEARDPGSVRVILVLLEDDDPWIRMYAVNWLCVQARTTRETRAQVLPRLLPLLESPDPSVRWNAWQAIGDMGQDAADALPKLRVFLQTEKFNEVAVWAALAVKRIDPDDQDAIPFLIRVVEGHKDPSRGSWVAAARAADVLGTIDPPVKDAVPALLEAAKRTDNKYLSISATNALQKIDPEAAKRAALGEQ